MDYWRPIETAPKNKTVMLFRPTAIGWMRVCPGRYSNSRYPYWVIRFPIGSIQDARDNPPTMWMPFPTEPYVEE